MKQQAVELALGVLHRRDRRVGRRGDDLEARRRARRRSRRGSPRPAATRAVRRTAARRRRQVTTACPYSRLRRRLHLAAEHVASSAACRSRCRASACPARTSPDRRAARPASETLVGPPDRMMPAGLAPRNLRRRRRRRQDLRVDRQLAQAARNQLRVLRAEIENENRLMCHRRPGCEQGRGRSLARMSLL